MKLRKIITKDGSATYYNEEYQDSYHSTTVGALEEAEIKYVMQLNLFEDMKVLDFCFGLGYNSLVLISKLKSCEIVGIEKDKDILDKIEKTDVPRFKTEYEIIKKVAKNLVYNNGIKIKIIIDDAINAVKLLEDSYFDGILFDPFSPNKNPELWTKSIFLDMWRIMKPKSRLVTYSCAKKVRENMKKAGFKVLDGPKFGRRGPTTIAVKYK